MTAEDLIQQLEATHDGNPWYGTAREKLLAGVSAEQAIATPIPGGHSIWQQVLHMTSWTREVTRRVRGAAPSSPVEGDWPEPRGEGGRAWAEAKRGLAEAHRELIATLRNLPDSRWQERVGTTREPSLETGITVLGTAIGLAQHDAYHIAQIAMLRRALGSG